MIREFLRGMEKTEAKSGRLDMRLCYKLLTKVLQFVDKDINIKYHILLFVYRLFEFKLSKDNIKFLGVFQAVQIQSKL